MKIEKLNLIGFGKFQNREIELNDGINVFYGENEAGKTTIHNFINGMFYGFLRPYVTRTLYMDEHEHYNPWNGLKYSGSIDFTKDAIPYKIERDFTKGSEKTSVFNRTTGKDITNSIDLGDGGRVLQPGFHFFEFNDAVYSNTISIKQLGSKTEAELANEVRDRLANLSSSKDEGISIDNAVAALDRQIKNIGSERAPTSPYAIKLKKIEALRNRRKELEEDRQSYEENLLIDGNLELKLDHSKKIVDSLSRDLEKSLKYEKKLIVDNFNKLNLELEDIRKDKEELMAFKELDEDDYFKLIELKKDIDNYELRLVEVKKDIVDLEKEVAEYDYLEEAIFENKASDKYIEIEELELERDSLLEGRENTNIESLRNEMSTLFEKIEHNRKLLPMVILLTVLTVVSVFVLDSYIMLFLNIFTIPLMLYFRKTEIESDNKIKDITKIIDEIKENNKFILEKVDSLDSKEREIFKEFEVQSKHELKRLADRIDMEHINKKSRKNEIEEKREKLGRTMAIMNKLDSDRSGFLLKKKEFLEKNKSDSIEEFKLGLDKKKEFDRLSLNEANKLELIERSKKDYDIDELKAELVDFDSMDYSYIKSDDLRDKLIVFEEELASLVIEKNVMTERLNSLNKSIKELLDIDESMDRLDKEVAIMDSEKAGIDLARNTILSLSEEIHNEFAPDMNKRVGQIVGEITNGKYENIKIDEDLNISVVNPVDKQLVDINNLSGGTIDQLYFALRFGIIDEVKDSSLPLILDDCFIQYDDERLKGMMKFLVEESKTRQIILFTCHNREKTILNNMGVDYKLIRL